MGAWWPCNIAAARKFPKVFFSIRIIFRRSKLIAEFMQWKFPGITFKMDETEMLDSRRPYITVCQKNHMRFLYSGEPFQGFSFLGLQTIAANVRVMARGWKQFLVGRASERGEVYYWSSKVFCLCVTLTVGKPADQVNAVFCRRFGMRWNMEHDSLKKIVILVSEQK